MKKYLLLIASFILTLQIKAQTVSDVDGNTYNTVTIGTQTWLKENLKTTKYNDGTAIPNVTSNAAWSALTTPAYCWYNNNAAAYKATYGALYNWYAVNTEKLCPTGWHVPSDAEWITLENYLIANGYNYDGTITGNKIAKALSSSTTWRTDTFRDGTPGNPDYPNKQNVTGFSAVAAGRRDSNFDMMGDACYLWSSLEGDSNSAWRVLLGTAHPESDRYSWDKYYGFSVRCLKDTNTTSINIAGNSIDKIIYPNPATDNLFIKNSKSSDATVAIFDIQGKQVINLQIDSNPIDISTLSKGIYLVKIIDSGNIIMDKLIKE